MDSGDKHSTWVVTELVAYSSVALTTSCSDLNMTAEAGTFSSSWSYACLSPPTPRLVLTVTWIVLLEGRDGVRDRRVGTTINIWSRDSADQHSSTLCEWNICPEVNLLLSLARWNQDVLWDPFVLPVRTASEKVGMPLCDSAADVLLYHVLGSLHTPGFADIDRDPYSPPKLHC